MRLFTQRRFARFFILFVFLAGACVSQQPLPTLIPTYTLAPISLPSWTPPGTLPPSTETAVPLPSPTLPAPPTITLTVPPTETAATVVLSPTLPAPPTLLPSATLTPIPALVGSLSARSAPVMLRAEPSFSAQVSAILSGGTIVRARSRSADTFWIEIVTLDGTVGWVQRQEITTLADLAALPLADSSVIVVLAPTIQPTRPQLGDVPAMERRLFETPILYNLATERVYQIFEYGRSLGSRADVFTTIGDSNTTNGDFLQPIGMGANAYCSWGDYAYLRETVSYFSVPPSISARNSFTHHSETAQMGFNTAAVLDPFWATGGGCASGETPLTCEYRTIQPSVAIIMLGGIDVNDLTTAAYDANLRTIVQTSIQRGVIPVLTTFVVLPERDVYARSLEFNMMLLDIVEQEQIPLINLWAAAQALPDEGIGPDHTHLKAQVGSFCAFDGAEQQLGGTLRNLLTLQALDTLRQNVLSH